MDVARSFIAGYAAASARIGAAPGAGTHAPSYVDPTHVDFGPTRTKLHSTCRFIDTGTPVPMSWTNMLGTRTRMSKVEQQVWWYQTLRTLYTPPPCYVASDEPMLWVGVAASLPYTEQPTGIVPNFNAAGVTHTLPDQRWTWHGQIRGGRLTFLALGVAYSNALEGATKFAANYSRVVSRGSPTVENVARGLARWKRGKEYEWPDFYTMAGWMLQDADALAKSAQRGATNC